LQWVHFTRRAVPEEYSFSRMGSTASPVGSAPEGSNVLPEAQHATEGWTL
jgi:hypothetical protein